MVECDVLVVGSGVAGISAARSAALDGAETIVIEKNVDSVKTACAEAISHYLMPLLPFKIPRSQLIWNIDGVEVYADGFSITKIGDNWRGFSIDRNKFNPWLTHKATEAGAKVYFNTKLVDLKLDKNGFVKKAIAVRDNKKMEIKPRAVIAADGAKSDVSKILGLRREKKYSLAHITSFEICNANIKNPNVEQIFFDDFAPRGFAYIFPKSQSTANVGIGVVGGNSNDTKAFFDDFLDFDIVKKQLEKGKLTVDRSGYAPVDYILDKSVYGNTIFVGDIANQNIKPFIEGIIPGIVCGDIAGRCASEFIRYKFNLYEQYNNLIKQKLGKIMQFSDSILKLMMEIFKQGDKKAYLLLLALSTELFDFLEYPNLLALSYPELRKKIEKIISHKNL